MATHSPPLRVTRTLLGPVTAESWDSVRAATTYTTDEQYIIMYRRVLTEAEMHYLSVYAVVIDGHGDAMTFDSVTDAEEYVNSVLGLHPRYYTIKHASLLPDTPNGVMDQRIGLNYAKRSN